MACRSSHSLEVAYDSWMMLSPSESNLRVVLTCSTEYTPFPYSTVIPSNVGSGSTTSNPLPALALRGRTTSLSF